MYDEMTIIGQDIAKGNCAKSFSDVELHSHENVRNLTKKGHCLSDTVTNNEKYLEDKIEMYDETMVAGEGAAGGNCANSFDNIEPESHENSIHLVEKGDCVGETSKDEDKQSTSSVGLPLESMKVRKRAHEGVSEIQMISTQLKEIAMALQRLSKSQLDVGQLYEEVMKTKGFEEELLVCAFDHLLEKENQARGFLAKSDKLRKIWLQKFKENNH